MPDFVDKIFDYTTIAAEGTAAVLQDGYSISKDALQYSFDISKNVGGSVWDSAKYAYEKVQENVPSELTLMSYTKSPPPPPPPSTVSGLIHSNLSGYLSRNSKAIGLGISIPTLVFTAYTIYRYYVPYKRYAERLLGGQRYEVILVVGSMSSRFVFKLVSDLNMRGYLVFVTVSDESQLQLVEELNDPDIRPLFIDQTNESSIKNSMLKLGQILDTKIDNLDGEYYYNFKGVLVIPDYSKLPKIRKLEELSSREFVRITESFFLKFNNLLYHGILTFIRESNNRRSLVQQYNSQQIKGGYAKLLFINFMIVPDNDSRRLVHNLSLDINKIFFDKLYDENAISFKDSVSRVMNNTGNFSSIDMSSLDVFLHKNHDSTMVPDYPVIQDIISILHRRMTPKDVHHKVFDLLNQNVLLKRYKLEN